MRTEGLAIPRFRGTRRGFTLVELLVVIGVVAIFLAVLVPSYLGIQRSALRTESQSNMKQIFVFMQQYAGEYRETIVPSRFNYQDNAVKGNVCDEPALRPDQRNRGTWADIIWTHYELGKTASSAIAQELNPGGGVTHDYSKVAPDDSLYRQLEEREATIPNILRSTATNTREVAGGTGALPFGTGAQALGLPGYFAANNFFSADQDDPEFNGTWTTGQIRQPERSLYLVDSYAGEIIEDEPEPWDVDSQYGDPDKDARVITGASDCQVDFRYAEKALVLFLDGHVEPVGAWKDLDRLETIQRIRVRDLDRRETQPQTGMTPGGSGVP